jgi:hypothetical protein
LSKKKSAKALFEVITTYRQKHPGSGPLMPEWMRRKQPSAPGQMPQLQPEPVAEEPLRPAATGATVRTLRPLSPPIIDTSDGRLNISLNYVSSVVVALGLVVLLVAMFLLGRLTASPSAAKPAGAKPATAARTGAADRTAVDQHKARRVDYRLLLEDQELPRGKYYFVVQVLRGGYGEEQKEDAGKIARFCGGRPAGTRIPAVKATYVAKNGDRYWVVLASEPFETDQLTSPVKALAKKAEALGRDPANPTTYPFKLDRTLLLLHEE